MSTNHLRQQAGGNPSQGPSGEMANPTPSPAAGEDFPDAPDPTNSGRDQDQPDLDAFAERLGLDTKADADEDAASSDGANAEPGSDDDAESDGSQVADLRKEAATRAKATGTKARSVTGSTLRWLSKRFGKLADRVEPD